MKFIIKLLITTLAIMTIAKIVPGIAIENFGIAVVSALVLAILNAVLRPIIILLTLPINILTLGLLTLFINGFILFITSKLINGFAVSGFWPAFWGGIIISVISFILNIMLGTNKVQFFGRTEYTHNKGAKKGDVIDIEVVENKPKGLNENHR